MITYTDIFCGAGGSSIGLTEAGLELKLAANHWARAIETHSANFPDAEHLCADVSNYDMRRLPKTDVLWASPICTEVSPAGGRRRTRGQLDLLEQGPIANAGFDRTRATFHDVIRATEVHRYSAVLVENVTDVADVWELFDWWVDGMRHLGYNVQYLSVSSAHIGGAGNPHAPQWRDRLYLVFTKTGIPLPDIAPHPTAWCEPCGADVAAIQAWKKPGRHIGKYRQQYAYRCPNTTCRHSLVEPYVLPAAAAIDWSNLGTRIGDRPRPLAKNTLARIRAGLEQFASPITLEAAGNTFERRPGVRTWPAEHAPLTTLTTTATKALACPPMLVPAGGTWRDTAAPVDLPMGARTTRETDGLLCPPMVVELRNHCTASPTDEPLSTVAAGGNHHGLVVPPGAFYVKNYGGDADAKNMVKSLDVPLGTVTARDHHSLVIPYYRSSRATTTATPLGAVTSREHFALVDTALEVQDCLFRMLQPREHLRAQRFPDTYTVTGNQGEQTMQAGNAVSANVAHFLGKAVAAVLGGTSPQAQAS